MTRSIGSRCTHGNMFSRGVLISRETFLILYSSRIGGERPPGRQHDSVIHLPPSCDLRSIHFDYSQRERFGGDGVGETPLPIPNREVKPYCADGTMLVTAWESRSPPSFLLNGPFSHSEGAVPFSVRRLIACLPRRTAAPPPVRVSSTPPPPFRPPITPLPALPTERTPHLPEAPHRCPPPTTDRSSFPPSTVPAIGC